MSTLVNANNSSQPNAGGKAIAKSELNDILNNLV